MAYYVQIDHATQSPYSDGPEMPADRLSVRYDEFLWLYVNAELPTGSALHGEYYPLGSSARTPLDPPTVSGHQYRFSLIHYILLPASHYMFHFADDLSVPKYQDQWEVVTLADETPRRRCLKGIKSIEKAIIAYVQQHPGATGSEIDDALGIPSNGGESFGETLRCQIREAGQLRGEVAQGRWYLPTGRGRHIV
jgi:hypothetical protein